ncbi:hypothetical protein JCM3766R1_001883 [Sporobolomyces carnicolor]
MVLDSDSNSSYETAHKLGRSHHHGFYSSRDLDAMLQRSTTSRKSDNMNGYLKNSRSNSRRRRLGGQDSDDDSATPKPPSQPRVTYFREVAEPSRGLKTPIKPKSRLLVSDLDNTLFGPSGDGVVARPYLKTFLRYIMHPDTPYALAIWTFSGRRWGQAHLRQAGVGDLLFEDAAASAEPRRRQDRRDSSAAASEANGLEPRLKEPLKVFWGYEDSGFLPSPPHAYGSMASGPAVKDLELIWELLNIQGKGDWSPFNSLIVDDQISNGRLEPDSIMVCPLFTANSPDDDFLLAFIGVLDELAPESNFAAVIKRRRFSEGIALGDLDRYSERGKAVCLEYGIKVSRGTPYHDPAFIEDVKRSIVPVATPVHDAAREPAEPHAGSFTYARPVPKRVAKGMPLSPSNEYLAQVAQKSEIGAAGKPLVVFDLDGTLYCRPPQNLEHDPSGEPTGRPYLRSVLAWILRPESPWTVAIWTGSQKATAVRCLYELDLGIVGPKLVDGDQAEILHPKIKAVWAREDFDLTPEDYRSYVAVVKDLSRLWKYLRPYRKFDATNSVIVDDTPTKLRAQPDNLIVAPTFDYPEAPSDSTTRRSQLDTFLLAVVSMLDQLAPETNFANFIESRGWNQLQLGTEEEDDDERDELVNDGVRLVRKAKIAVDAEARGILPGTLPSVNDYAGYRTRKRGTLQGGLGSTALAVTTNSSSRLLTLDDALARVPNGAYPYHSDSSSDTSESIDGDADDAAEQANHAASSSAVLSLGRHLQRRH